MFAAVDPFRPQSALYPTYAAINPNQFYDTLKASCLVTNCTLGRRLIAIYLYRRGFQFSLGRFISGLDLGALRQLESICIR